MKTVTIEIPDDSELIKEENIYKICRVIPKTWEEFCNRTPIRQEYFIGYDSKINLRENKGRTPYGDRNLHASEEEAEAFLALMQLRQLRKAWICDWEQPNSHSIVYVIKYDLDTNKVRLASGNFWGSCTLSFPILEMAKEFLNCFRDLCETAKILL